MSGPVRSLDLAELRAFCAAVDLGSLGRAARLLRVSQPALSKRMRAMEAVVGTPPVERPPRGLTPPPARPELFAEARQPLPPAGGGGRPRPRPARDEAPGRAGRGPPQ